MFRLRGRSPIPDVIPKQSLHTNPSTPSSRLLVVKHVPSLVIAWPLCEGFLSGFCDSSPYSLARHRDTGVCLKFAISTINCFPGMQGEAPSEEEGSRPSYCHGMVLGSMRAVGYVHTATLGSGLHLIRCQGRARDPSPLAILYRQPAILV